MSKEIKNPAKRDQALNDATEGQFGKQPQPEINPNLKKQDLINNAMNVHGKVKREKYIAK